MSDCKPTPSNTMCHLLCLQQQPSYIDILMYKQRDCSSDPLCKEMTNPIYNGTLETFISSTMWKTFFSF